MQPSEWEIIILKPTPVFLSFLASQLPGVELPVLPLLQTDNTAYVIRRQANDEATLDEIERHFPRMFRHEIQRWLGEQANCELEGSFLDFLCCFRFEMHSQMVLFEDRLEDAAQLLRVRPKTVLLKWMKSAVEGNGELVDILERVNLTQLSENATVVVRNFSTLSDIKPFLRANWRPVFEAEMLRMCDMESQWPEVESWEDFNRYFNIAIHTQVVHLERED